MYDLTVGRLPHEATALGTQPPSGGCRRASCCLENSLFSLTNPWPPSLEHLCKGPAAPTGL